MSNAVTTFEMQGLKSFEKKCRKLSQGYDLMATEFMRFEAQKITKDFKNASIYPSFRSGYYTKTNKLDGIESWKAIKNKKPHLHLVRDGHRMFIKGVDTGKRVPPHPVLNRDVVNDFMPIFEEDLQKFMDGKWDEISRVH